MPADKYGVHNYLPALSLPFSSLLAFTGAGHRAQPGLRVGPASAIGASGCGPDAWVFFGDLGPCRRRLVTSGHLTLRSAHDGRFALKTEGLRLGPGRFTTRCSDLGPWLGLTTIGFTPWFDITTTARFNDFTPFSFDLAALIIARRFDAFALKPPLGSIAASVGGYGAPAFDFSSLALELPSLASASVVGAEAIGIRSFETERKVPAGDVLTDRPDESELRSPAARVQSSWAGVGISEQMSITIANSL